MITLTELLKDYRNSIERALAGEMTGKRDEELSDDDVTAASEASKKIVNLADYLKLVPALDNESDITATELLQKYSVKHMSEAEYIDRDVMMREGFKYFGVFEDEKLRGSITSYLDENEIEYMDDGTGHVQMRFGDRDSAYRVEEHIARMVRQCNPRFMRDHKDQAVSLGEEELDEFNPFKPFRASAKQAKKTRFNHINSIPKLQAMADRLSGEGAPSRPTDPMDPRRQIQDRIRELENGQGVEEGSKQKSKKRKPAKPRDPSYKTMLAKRQSGAAGPHSSTKYNKGDRRRGNNDAQRGVHDE